MTITYKSLPGSTTESFPYKKLCCSRLCIFSYASLCLLTVLIIMYICMELPKRIFNKPQQPNLTSDAVVKDSASYETESEPTGYHTAKRRFPGAVIIGVRKGGTRAMIEYLSLHPDVVTARPEIHFFDREENYSKGKEWYLGKMPYSTGDELTIEKTPRYFTVPIVPERVHRLIPNVKLILLVRDPVERAISDYTQIHIKSLSHGKLQRPFKVLAVDARTGAVRRHYVAVERSLYYRHLMRWLKYFPLENFLIINTRDLVETPFEMVQLAEDFLGLKRKVKRSDFYYNATKGFYCMIREDGRHCLSPSKGRMHVSVDRVTREKLRTFFRPFNRKFYRLVGRDFGWD